MRDSTMMILDKKFITIFMTMFMWLYLLPWSFAQQCKPDPKEVFKEPVEENVVPKEKAPSDKKDVYSWQAKNYKSIKCEFPQLLDTLGQPKGNPSSKEDVLRWQKNEFKNKRQAIQQAVKKK